MTLIAIVLSALVGLALGLAAEWVIAKRGWKRAVPISVLAAASGLALGYAWDLWAAAIALGIAYVATNAANGLFRASAKAAPPQRI